MTIGSIVSHILVTKTLYATPKGLRYYNLKIIIDGMVVAMKDDWAYVKSQYGTHQFLISTLIENE